MERKEYTQEEILSIEKEMDNLTINHDRWSIRELCKKEEYAIYYFVNKAMDEISTIEHIKNIITNK